jgi:cephalosporin hydroxylase
MMIERSSTDSTTVAHIFTLADGWRRVLVILDSYHTQDQVLEELGQYSPLVGEGSNQIVFVTAIDDLPTEFSADGLLGLGNTLKTMVLAILEGQDWLVIDRGIEDKLLITAAHSGYLRCIKD